MKRATCLAMCGALVIVLLAATGCGRRLSRALLPDDRPTVTLEHTRLDPPAQGSYAYLARWTGVSSGRAISHFLYAIDPASVDAVDATWVKTIASRMVLTFPQVEKNSSARRSHVFVIRAVDDHGEMSEPRWFAVAGDNLPPIVVITQPRPNSAFTALVPPTVRIHWTGFDPDGQATQKPVEYRFRLFGQHNPDFPGIPDFIAFARTYPDSLRALYAPTFPGWTSAPPESIAVTYVSDLLTVGSSFLFAITAFDEAGDYDPIFSTSKNLLAMAVVAAGSLGPVLTMFNESFNYRYPTGGWSTDPSRRVKVDMPAGQPLTFHWFGTPTPPSDIAWYRWVLDPVDLFDETPRSHEGTDFHLWSARSRATTSATVGPFNPAAGSMESHVLYIDVEDTHGLRSLGIVHFTVRQPTFANELLFVDDTRLRVDSRSGPGQEIDPPAGPWPTAAELDSFLFARGGVPWRGYPPGTLSQPGIFNGYAFDTVGTRARSSGVSFALLSSYRHVVWYTDPFGASLSAPPSDPVNPMTELRRMSAPGQMSALAAYVQQGGKLWLAGGGAAFATLITWNRPGTAPNEYTARDLELVPGRMMYDFVHWREGVQMAPAINARKFGTTNFGVGTNRPGRHWPPSPPPPTPPAPPNYALLPANLDPRNPATDPVPPLRNPDSFFYIGDYTAEYIHRPTFIREDYNDDPDILAEYSTLDTLYIIRGGTALQNSPVMTYYHGRESQPLVFSGFDFWYWRRPQCIELVDWVLQSVWGLQRHPGAPREPLSAAAVLPTARAAPGTTRGRLR